MGDFTNMISRYTKGLISQDIKYIISQNIRPSLKVVILMILVAGIVYPLLLVMIGEITQPMLKDNVERAKKLGVNVRRLNRKSDLERI